MDILHVSTETHGESALLRLEGEIDLSSVDVMRRAALDLLHRGARLARLEIDFAGVTFLDSTGIGALLDISTKAQQTGTTLTLTNVAAAPHRAIRAAGLAPVLLGEAGFVQPRRSVD
ncbi:MAG: STAS domain-containing protein [Actinomycetes bacterium]